MSSSTVAVSKEVNVNMTDRGHRDCVTSSGKYCDPLYGAQENTLVEIKTSKTNN